jgi:hypothetical protein
MIILPLLFFLILFPSPEDSMIKELEAIGEEKMYLPSIIRKTYWGHSDTPDRSSDLKLYHRASAGLKGAPRSGGGIAAMGGGGRARFPICR